MLERRPFVGGAAITEELRPGFWFTTFSYALSLLRPDIIHDLELTKHGFMPLLMPTTFAPMEDGDYLLLGQDTGENLQEIRRHSKHDADAYEAFEHDITKVLQVLKPLMDMVPPDIFSDDPDELVALARLGSRFKRLDKKVAARLRAAADGLRRGLPGRLLRVATSSRATSRRRASSGPRSGRRRRAPGWCCCTTSSASTTACSAPGRSTRGATAGSRRCSPGRRSRSGRRSGSRQRSRRSRRGTARSRASS